MALPSIDLGFLTLQFVVFLFSLSFHEMAHAWAADRLGDPTARLQGRLTLNPISHVDLFGTLLLPLLAALSGLLLIGWAVPVPVQRQNLRQPRRDHALIAAAGPASNVLLAVLAALGLRLAGGAVAGLGSTAGEPLMMLLLLLVQINLLLAVFNLVPVPPLDGSWILSSMLPGAALRRYEALRPYGILLLYALIVSPLWGDLIVPVVEQTYRLLLPA